MKKNMRTIVRKIENMKDHHAFLLLKDGQVNVSQTQIEERKLERMKMRKKKEEEWMKLTKE